MLSDVIYGVQDIELIIMPSMYGEQDIELIIMLSIYWEQDIELIIMILWGARYYYHNAVYVRGARY